MSQSNEEGKPDEQGGVQPVPPSASQAQPSVDLAALKKQVEEQDRVIRALQSGKDRRWNEYEPLLKRFADELGEDKFKAIQREAALDELVAGRVGTPQPEKQSPAQTVPTAPKVEVATLVDALGLGMDDPGVVALTATIEDPTQLLAAIGRYAKKKATSPTPNAAQAPVSPGKAPSGDVPPEKLMADYQKELSAARGNAKLFHQIREKYKNLGLNVDGIVFH
jgi:hypothetical protein